MKFDVRSVADIIAHYFSSGASNANYGARAIRVVVVAVVATSPAPTGAK